MQSICMNPKWAEDNLQTIRTLMERSAVYRRALAPVVCFAGVMGILATVVGIFFHLNSACKFGGLWMSTAIIAVIGALFIVRRQALRERDIFWSPPTRRVVQALLPPLVIGMVLGAVLSLSTDNAAIILPLIWALLYGCALHSAGFFISSGVKWFGWGYILFALGIFVSLIIAGSYYLIPKFSPHLLMAFFFGVLHLAYGAYLYLTEQRKRAT